jgi:hypothetical protein|tara:strand:+ start:65 stop:241 length:177 start_codon:yes stop_codon:yes gene_type:complete
MLETSKTFDFEKQQVKCTYSTGSFYASEKVDRRFGVSVVEGQVELSDQELDRFIEIPI